jgi:hypothetical protein
MNAKTYVVTCTLANTAYNIVTGTTVAPTLAGGTFNYDHKGRGIIFQCQTNGALGKAGMSNVVSLGGIVFLGPDGAYEPVAGVAPNSYNANDWWVSCDTAGGVVVVQLIKAL